MKNFKFIATGDSHFGLTTDGQEDPETGLNSRSLDAFQAFDQLINFTIENKIKLITHSGDVFNSKTVPQIIINEFYKRVKRISDAKIDLVILSGNHDKNSAAHQAKCSLDLVNTVKIHNVYETDGSELFDLGYIQIATIGYYLSNEEIEIQLKKFANEIDFTRPSLLIAHLQVETPQFVNASFKEDLHLTPLNLLTKYPFQFISLGHLHKPVTLCENPKTMYNGSLARCSFAEAMDPKGFNVVEIDGINPVKVTRESVTCLKMCQIKGEMGQISEALETKNPNDFKNTIVKIVITNTDNEDINYKLLKTFFSQAFKLRLSKEAKTKELKKMDAIGLSSLNQYAEKYFSDQPRKIELMKLLEEIKSMEELIVK